MCASTAVRCRRYTYRPHNRPCHAQPHMVIECTFCQACHGNSFFDSLLRLSGTACRWFGRLMVRWRTPSRFNPSRFKTAWGRLPFCAWKPGGGRLPFCVWKPRGGRLPFCVWKPWDLCRRAGRCLCTAFGAGAKRCASGWGRWSVSLI